MLYHISCQDNVDSIQTYGLVPGQFVGYEKSPMAEIYLAKNFPSFIVSEMRYENILDGYLLERSDDRCQIFRLFEINPAYLDPRFIRHTGDDRELAYGAIIPPQAIRLVRIKYFREQLNEQYNALNM